MNAVRTNQLWRGQSPALSVVMIGYRSAALLSRAVYSLLRTAPTGAVWELVIVRNGDDPGVAEWCEELLLSERLPMALVPVSERRPGAARNAGVRVSRAPVLLFLDDDIECFDDVVGPAIELFRDPAIEAAGGANLTPPGSGALARATGGVMGSWFGAAAMRWRYRVGKEGAATEHGLILCNLAVRRSVFEAERGFATHLISNEENVLLQRMAARGARLWVSPRLAVYHARRNSWRGLWAQAAKYGAGRAQNLLLLPETFRALYFLPTLFLAYLVAAPFLFPWLGGLLWAPLAAYVALAFAGSLVRAIATRDAAQLLGLLVCPFVHLAYGFGFAGALFAWARRRELLREHAA